MKKINKIALLLTIALVFSFMSFSMISANAATKKAAPVGKKWVKSGSYEFQLTNDGVLNCKYKKKTREVATRVEAAFIYGSDVLYKTDASIRIYEGKIDTSYTVSMMYADTVSTSVPLNDIIIAGYGKGIIYYTAPVNRGQRCLFAFDNDARTVEFVASHGYISKVYCVDKFIYLKTNTSAESNTTGCLCRIDVTTGKEKILSYDAISVSFDNKNVYWAEPAADYTYTLGIGSLTIKSCGVTDTKEKTITTLDNIDTYKTVVCMPKYVTCTSQAGTTFKYTYKNKQKTAYETYQQKELMMNSNVLH